MMKVYLIITFLIGILLITPTTLAQIKYSGINVDVDDEGKSFVELSLTLSETVDEFNIEVLGYVRNLKATTDIGTINCNLKRDGVSSISCKTNVTAKSILKLSFETDDFVNQVENKSYLSAKLRFDNSIEHFVFSITLPEDARIEEFYPEEPKFLSDAFVVWSFLNTEAGKLLEFELTYEHTVPVVVVTVPEVFPWKYILAGALIVAGMVFFILQKIRKPREVILSVLDDYEKRVINIIIASGGEVNQKKVVKETNLSKAKVSRVVKTLENRGLIEVQRLGRTNKLKLVKKKFEF